MVFAVARRVVVDGHCPGRRRSCRRTSSRVPPMAISGQPPVSRASARPLAKASTAVDVGMPSLLACASAIVEVGMAAKSSGIRPLPLSPARSVLVAAVGVVAIQIAVFMKPSDSYLDSDRRHAPPSTSYVTAQRTRGGSPPVASRSTARRSGSPPRTTMTPGAKGAALRPVPAQHFDLAHVAWYRHAEAAESMSSIRNSSMDLRAFALPRRRRRGSGNSAGARRRLPSLRFGTAQHYPLEPLQAGLQRARRARRGRSASPSFPLAQGAGDDDFEGVSWYLAATGGRDQQ